MHDRYDPSAFEQKWQKRWKEANLFRTTEDPNKPFVYCLDFFPYPSGSGLSVGHCKNYIPTDVLARMKRMQGYNVLHPMGFDAFGLPAENAAIKQKRHPAPMIKEFGETYRRQMDLVGISYDWERSFSSCEPEYYRWTQWIFKLLFERGLAYQKLASVNWDPVDKTVLADEEVIAGRAERSGALVEKRWIPQWFFKITDYAQRLLDDLETIDWPEGIKAQQRNWIGRSEGVQFRMQIAFETNPTAAGELWFEAFTTRIDTLFGVTFCVLAPEHPLMGQILDRVSAEHRDSVEAYRQQARLLSDTDRQAENREKTGVFTGAYAIHPVSGEKVPLWTADYVLATYGTGAIMAVPAHDERDYAFAQKFGIPVIQVIQPADGTKTELPFVTKEGKLIGSGEFNGLSCLEAMERLGIWFEDHDLGTRKVQFKLRDWLISRQRYWGCPIPILHDADGNMHVVPDDQLPVLLPEVEHYEPSGDGSSPLAHIKSFVETVGPDGRPARRETDTMGGFACSSWYFFRFCDPHNAKQAWDLEAVKKWMPVHFYVGGAEHAVMHLLYARFWTKVLFDLGLSPVAEPFATLHNQGQILGYTPYRAAQAGETLSTGEDGILLSFEDAAKLPKEDVIWRWSRMSKSKGNVVTPEQAAESFGVDALRIYELFVAPFDADVQWSNDGMNGAVRFLSRVFKLCSELEPFYQKEEGPEPAEPTEASRKLRRITHHTIQKVTLDIEKFAFNTAVSQLMIFVNEASDLLKQGERSETFRFAASEALTSLVFLIAPMAPHTADEIWSSLGNDSFTFSAGYWPVAIPELAIEDTITLAIQVNGKLRDTLEIANGASEAEMEAAALASPKVQAHLEGKSVRKVIVVKGKLVNLVVG